MLIRIANREDIDQTASDLGLHCLSRPLVFEILEHLPKASFYCRNERHLLTFFSLKYGYYFQK